MPGHSNCELDLRNFSRIDCILISVVAFCLRVRSLLYALVQAYYVCNTLFCMCESIITYMYACPHELARSLARGLCVVLSAQCERCFVVSLTRASGVD